MHGVGAGNVQLSSAAQICIRPGPTIQFGLDSGRAGVFDAVASEAVQGVALALLTARHVVPVGTVAAGLSAAGLSESGAWSLIEDLLRYRVLRCVPDRPLVAVWGSGLLATRTAEMLRQCGVGVRLPVPGEDDSAFLSRVMAEHDMPVVVLDRPLAATQALSEFASTWFPLQLIDGRGHLGPLHIRGVGACPMCLDLRRAEFDPSWGAVERWEPTPAQDPPVLATVVARLVACVLTFLGFGPEPPGTQPLRLTPGEVQVIDVFADDVSRWHVEPHPHCPACWSRNNK